MSEHSPSRSRSSNGMLMGLAVVGGLLYLSSKSRAVAQPGAGNMPIYQGGQGGQIYAPNGAGSYPAGSYSGGIGPGAYSPWSAGSQSNYNGTGAGWQGAGLQNANYSPFSGAGLSPAAFTGMASSLLSELSV